jgi:hypothetical protein
VIFLKKNHLENGLKTFRLHVLYRYCTAVLLEYFSTSFIMNFLALNDDVKFIISKHLASDLKIRACVCMYVYMYVCICMYVCIYVCMYVISVCTYACTQCLSVRTYPCVCMRVRMYLCMYTWVHVVSVRV